MTYLNSKEIVDIKETVFEVYHNSKGRLKFRKSKDCSTETAAKKLYLKAFNCDIKLEDISVKTLQNQRRTVYQEKAPVKNAKNNKDDTK